MVMTQRSLIIIGYILLLLVVRFLFLKRTSNKKPLLVQWRIVISDPTAVVLMLSMAMALGLPLLEFSIRQDAVFSFGAILIGLALIIIGLGIAYIAKGEIGESWSPIIEKREDQKLITSGIYGMVRHPLYLSGLLILAGTNIYFGSKWALVGTVAAMVIILVRIPLEEKKLIKRFGQEYISYRRHTKRILPWIF